MYVYHMIYDMNKHMSILRTHDFHISIEFFVPFCSISLILCFPIFFSLLFLNSFFFSIDYIQIDVTRNLTQYWWHKHISIKSHKPNSDDTLIGCRGVFRIFFRWVRARSARKFFFAPRCGTASHPPFLHPPPFLHFSLLGPTSKNFWHPVHQPPFLHSSLFGQTSILHIKLMSQGPNKKI